MSEFNLTVEGGASVRLKTAGKYCDRDIVVTAEGGSDNGLVSAIVDRSVVEFFDDKVTQIGQYAFRGATELTKVCAANAEAVNGYAFFGCDALSYVDLPNCKTIMANAFNGSTVLEIFILRSETLCKLGSASNFSGTRIASGNGFFYVPSALVNDYKNANSWSTYASQFRALEEYTVDGTITGELDESKIY